MDMIVLFVKKQVNVHQVVMIHTLITMAELAIVLYPTSNLFVKGHRIRLDISSSNFPRFDVNPNTGDPIGTERRRAGADNRVHHNAAQASRIVLPIVRPNN